MLQSYFKIKDKHYKTLDYIKNNLNSQQKALSIKKKINKLNDYQFFFLLGDLMVHYPIENFTEDTLQLFFKKSELLLNQSEYFSLRASGNVNDFVPVIVDIAHLNCKNNVESLIDYFLNTKEYPKETLITKLLVLAEKIFKDIYHSSIIIKLAFDEYLENNKNITRDKKYDFQNDIASALNNYEIYLSELSYRIQEKIDTLSKTNIQNENYLIDIDKEILNKLYFALEKNMFIDQNKTTLQQFINVLKLDWKDHESVIYLEMNNIQFKYFIDCIYDFFKTNIHITFIERSGNIENKNGKIKARAVYSSVSKSTNIKKKELIKSIFEKI
jgi:hypothetical protein